MDRTQRNLYKNTFIIHCSKHIYIYEIRMFVMLYPARFRWETYRGCCSRRDGARTSG